MFDTQLENQPVSLENYKCEDILLPLVLYYHASFISDIKNMMLFLCLSLL